MRILMMKRVPGADSAKAPPGCSLTVYDPDPDTTPAAETPALLKRFDVLVAPLTGWGGAEHFDLGAATALGLRIEYSRDAAKSLQLLKPKVAVVAGGLPWHVVGTLQSLGYTVKDAPKMWSAEPDLRDKLHETIKTADLVVQPRVDASEAGVDAHWGTYRSAVAFAFGVPLVVYGTPPTDVVPAKKRAYFTSATGLRQAVAEVTGV
jgi:hypothetical protein